MTSNNFQKHKIWQTYQSQHYCFHYFKDSLAEIDILKIANTQEQAYKSIHEMLGENSGLFIKYYLFNTREEVGIAYGDDEPGNGFNRVPNEVHAVYNEKVKCIGPHEDGHLISYYLWGRPHKVFIREGLAEYLSKTWTTNQNGKVIIKTHEDWVSDFLINNTYISITKLYENEFFHKMTSIDGGSITYPIAGAFVTYLIKSYGIKFFIELFKSERTFEEIYSKKLDELELEFLNKLKQTGG